MPLSAQRKGEIALAALEARLRRDGLRLTKSSNRELGSSAIEAGVSPQEFKELLLELLPRLLAEAYDLESITLEATFFIGEKQIVSIGATLYGDTEELPRELATVNAEYKKSPSKN